jgi:hypothetical protein
LVASLTFAAACRHEPFIERWFGDKGDKRLQLQDFMEFVVQLHSIFDELEFALLDADGSGYITGLDLARSLVAPASVVMIDKLLNRVRIRFKPCSHLMSWPPTVLPDTVHSTIWSPVQDRLGFL